MSGFLRLGGNDSVVAAEEEVNLFWNDVDTNLRAGRIRMVFVSDTIPAELRRIVEFLNGQMNPAEVLAIEIKQFTGSGVTTLVPSVIGQTAQAAAQRNRSSGQGMPWDMARFLDALRNRKGEPLSRLAKRLLEWCDGVLPIVWWGRGTQDGSCFRGVKSKSSEIFLFSVWTYGKIEVQFQWFVRKPPFNSDAARMELLSRFNRVPGISFGPDVFTRRPSFDLILLENPDAEEVFHQTVQWAVALIESEANRGFSENVAK